MSSDPVFLTAQARVVLDAHIALTDIDFELDRGDFVVLLGPNGAGKTTLVLQILGLLAPTSGQVTVEGINAIRHPDLIKAFYGYMPQTRIAMRNIEVDRALYVTARLRRIPDRAAREQTERILDLLDLHEHRKTYLDRLSGGLMRVAALGMALMAEPTLIVLDEPTNELDPVRRRAVWEIIEDLNRARPVTCLLVTHNVLEAERVVERVAVIDRGRVVAVGTPGEAGMPSVARPEPALASSASAWPW